jgi:DNA-binding response OmpR family regulator
MRLLIVEDDAEASSAMARGLNEAGHEVVVAGDGEAGFNAAHQGRYDVMVVDRMMPKLDGVTMARCCGVRETRHRCCSCRRSARSRIASRA